MSHRARVSDFWDDVLEGWRADPGMADLPEPLRQWRNGYRGKVDLDGYPEGFLGDLRGEQREPRVVVLGLNPGIAYPELQGPNGEWTHLARKLTYSRSSPQRVPFENAAWRRRHGRDSRYWVNLIRFTRRWLKDTQAGVADILNFELFPFHSKKLDYAIKPPRELIDNFVWAPLQEMRVPVAFAFGKDWGRVCTDLLGCPIASYGPGTQPLLDVTRGNWQVGVYPLGAKRIVVSWQNGYAGPPSKNIDELRRIVIETAQSST
jgi:hypothetical protein